VQITVQTAFPGTPLHRRLGLEGRILEPGAWRKCTLFDVNFRPSHMTPGELRDGLLQLTQRLYTDAATRWRRRNWRRLAAAPTPGRAGLPSAVAREPA